MKLSEILRAGKQRIETLGWCQGDEDAFADGNAKGCCAATALPMGSTQISFGLAMTALDFLKQANGIDANTPLARWNDAPERTIEDVYAAYDKAIAAAEAQEQAQ
jgi:hypothetical protein